MFDDIFVNEDISKPENRINLALFHLQMDIDFHNWFFQKLNLDTNCVLYPIMNIDGSRPDFVIKNAVGKKIGYIEVECGTDPEQLSRFKNQYEKNGVKVFSIGGLKKYGTDISLEEIKDYILNIYDSILNLQEKLSKKYLVELINSTIYTIKDTKRKPVNENFIKENSFVNDLLNRLKELKCENVKRGHVHCDTTGPKGFSLQVYSPKGSLHKISLLNISGGRQFVTFQSEQKYKDYLAHVDSQFLDKWIAFICNTLRYPINKIKYNGKLSVPIDTVHQNINELVSHIRMLV